jgi:hypothetical protein
LYLFIDPQRLAALLRFAPPLRRCSHLQMQQYASRLALEVFMAYRLQKESDPEFQALVNDGADRLPLSACLPRPVDSGRAAERLDTIHKLLEEVRASLEKAPHRFEGRIASVRDLENATTEVANLHFGAAEGYRKAAALLTHLSLSHALVADDYREAAGDFHIYAAHPSLSSDHVTCSDVGGAPATYFLHPDLLSL